MRTPRNGFRVAGGGFRVAALVLLGCFLATGALFAQTTTSDPTVFVRTFEGRSGDVVIVDGDLNLDELGDVTLSSPQADDCLRFNGAVWVNSATCGGGGGGISLNSQTGSTQTMVVGTTGSDFAIVSAANVHTFRLPTASATNRGALSPGDWSTFNAKQPGDNDLTELAAIARAQGDLILGGASAWERLAIGSSGRALVSNGTTASWQLYQYADLSGTPATFAPADHVFVSATHTASGLTAGHILTALTSNTFGFAAFPAHASEHEDGAADEISVEGLSGLLADEQTPLAHVHAAADTTSGAFDPARLPNPSAGALGGVRSLTCGSTDKISAIGTDGIPVCSADDGGGGGLANAYVQMTDGTVTAAASAGDVFKFRSFDNKLSTEVQSNDGTHGDNLLLTINEANLVLSAIGGAVTDAQVPDDITVDLATLATTATTATTALAGDSATGFFPSGAVEVTVGGTGLSAGTSGGVPYFSSTTTMASSGALGANLPVIGGGAGNAPGTGTRSGNTTQFASVTGTKTVARYLSFDADGNVIASADGWRKFTIAETALTTSSTTEDETLFTCAQLCKIEYVVVKHSAAFTGGSISEMTVSVGTSGIGDFYSPPHDIFVAAGDTVFLDTNTFGSATMAAAGHNVIARFTAVGDDVVNATAGSVDIWVKVSTLP